MDLMTLLFRLPCAKQAQRGCRRFQNVTAALLFQTRENKRGPARVRSRPRHKRPTQRPRARHRQRRLRDPSRPLRFGSRLIAGIILIAATGNAGIVRGSDPQRVSKSKSSAQAFCRIHPPPASRFRTMSPGRGLPHPIFNLSRRSRQRSGFRALRSARRRRGRGVRLCHPHAL